MRNGALSKLSAPSPRTVSFAVSQRLHVRAVTLALEKLGSSCEMYCSPEVSRHLPGSCKWLINVAVVQIFQQRYLSGGSLSEKENLVIRWWKREMSVLEDTVQLEEQRKCRDALRGR